MQSSSHHDVYIYLGPSLSLQIAKDILPDANYLEPVRCGDILSLLRYKPKIIGIIDGYFESTAAVWHKEILHALSHNVAVFGASSMGALRASELHPFGMQGIGEIFTLYKNGIIEDDDEVVLFHGPAETKYKPLSEPLINIRFTLEELYKKHIITAPEKDTLLAIGKNIFYKERTLDKIISIAEIRKFLTLKSINRIREWLTSHGLIDQKSLDTISLLTKIKQELASPSPQRTSSANRSMFIKALQHKVDCEGTPRFLVTHTNNHEKTAIATLNLAKINKLLTRYAYLLSTVYALDIDTFFSLTDWEPIEKRYSGDWRKQNDCDDNFIMEFLKRAKNIFLKSGIQISDEVDEHTRKTLLNFLKLTGQFTSLNKNLKDSDSNIDKLKSFQEQLGDFWITQVDCARLWNVIYNQLNKSNLTPSPETKHRYIEKFYRQRKITTLANLKLWLEDNKLDDVDFDELMTMASCFDYIVTRSNLHILKINYPIEPNWWFRDALLLSGFYPKLKEMIRENHK